MSNILNFTGEWLNISLRHFLYFLASIYKDIWNKTQKNVFKNDIKL